MRTTNDPEQDDELMGAVGRFVVDRHAGDMQAANGRFLGSRFKPLQGRARDSAAAICAPGHASARRNWRPKLFTSNCRR